MTSETEPARARATDIFKIKPEAPSGLEDTLDAYLRHFVIPAKSSDGRDLCQGCGATMDGMRHALGIGAAYQWGLAHGEARCSACGYPARGMHYVKDADGKEIMTIRNFFLPYHPSEVEPVTEQET